MTAKNSKFISVIPHVLAIFYCSFSRCCPDRVLTNRIYLGTAKVVRYLPQLSCSLHPGL